MEDNLRNLVDANRTDIAKLNSDVSTLQDCVTTLFKNQKALAANQFKLGTFCALGFLGSAISTTALLIGYTDLALEPKTKITVEKKYCFCEEEKDEAKDINVDDVK